MFSIGMGLATAILAAIPAFAAGHTAGKKLENNPDADKDLHNSVMSASQHIDRLR